MKNVNKEKTPYLSVVIPCYNEERNIRLGAIESVAAFLSRKRYTWEVLIVDDGSSDQSATLISRIISSHKHIRLIQAAHGGKASAVITGVAVARGTYILFADLDQATPLSEVDTLLPYFQKGYDVVIGSRKNQRRGAPFFRVAMARGFMMLRNIILNLHIEDTQCGFKAFTKESAVQIFSHLKVYNRKQKAMGSTVSAGFDVEILYLAKRAGYRIAEVPIEWHYQETRHVNILKDSFEGIVDLLRIRMKDFLGHYADIQREK